MLKPRSETHSLMECYHGHASMKLPTRIPSALQLQPVRPVLKANFHLV